MPLSLVLGKLIEEDWGFKRDAVLEIKEEIVKEKGKKTEELKDLLYIILWLFSVQNFCQYIKVAIFYLLLLMYSVVVERQLDKCIL